MFKNMKSIFIILVSNYLMVTLGQIEDIECKDIVFDKCETAEPVKELKIDDLILCQQECQKEDWCQTFVLDMNPIYEEKCKLFSMTIDDFKGECLEVGSPICISLQGTC